MSAKEIFGNKWPTFEEQLANDPELRKRWEKSRRDLAKRPSNGEVLARHHRRIDASIAKATKKVDEKAEEDR